MRWTQAVSRLSDDKIKELKRLLRLIIDDTSPGPSQPPETPQSNVNRERSELTPSPDRRSQADIFLRSSMPHTVTNKSPGFPNFQILCFSQQPLAQAIARFLWGVVQ